MLVNIKIDGKNYRAEDKKNLLDFLLAEGFDIPHICHEKDLTPVGSCGICLVKIKGEGIKKACETTIKEGLEVITSDKEIERARKKAFIFLLYYSRHPTLCLFCDKYEECGGADNCLKGFKIKRGCKVCPKDGECILQELKKRFKITEFIEPEQRDIEQIKEPFFIRDYNYCILCSKCIRVCYEKRLQKACISYVKVRDHILSLAEQGCRFCGLCVDICPTSSLYSPYEERADYWVKTICPYCGVGCSLSIGIKDKKTVKIRADKEGINKGELCVKGRFGIIDFVNSKERLKYPLLRKGDSFFPISWEDAVKIICKNLKKYMGKIGVLGSAKCTNEENFLIQKFARLVLKTNNIDHCARLCHSSTAVALSMSLGYSAMTNSIDDIKEARTILVIGANPTENHPIIGVNIKRTKERGANLVVINPVRIELCDMADIWLRPYPGTDAALLNAMAKIILENGLEDRDFIKSNTKGFEKYRKFLSLLDINELIDICGVDLEELKKASRLYAEEKPSSIYFAMGITQHLNGTQNVLAISNLALLTGNLGRAGAGINPLRGQNNVQGACDMGVLPDLLPGYKPVEKYKKEFEKIWGEEIPSDKGLTLIEMMEAVIYKKINLMYIIGENPVITDPDASKTKEALKRCDFLIVQDIFLSDTARFADIVLPASSFAEKDGTFTNTERRVQRLRKAVAPPASARTDMEILCILADAMGYKRQFSYGSAEDVFNEIRMLVPQYRGITYERLEKGGIQWPCPDKEHPGTKILYLDGFKNRKAKFFEVDFRPKDNMPDKEFPFFLIIGRSLYHYHSGTMSMKVKAIKEIYPEPFIEISPDDAKRMGLSDGDIVKIYSKKAKIKGRIKISTKIKPGILFTTFHFPDMHVNLLTESQLDPLSNISALKAVPVRISK